jgi:hypothetical protein
VPRDRNSPHFTDKELKTQREGKVGSWCPSWHLLLNNDSYLIIRRGKGDPGTILRGVSCPFPNSRP